MPPAVAARVFVANAGSDDVSLLSPSGEALARAAAGGERPVSITIRDDRAYVLNAGGASVHGFTLGPRALEPLARSLYALPEHADPAQIAFAPEGESLIVTDRAGNSIVAIALDGEGSRCASTCFRRRAGRRRSSSYRVNASIAPVGASVPNTRSEVCWAVASADGRHRRRPARAGLAAL